MPDRGFIARNTISESERMEKVEMPRYDSEKKSATIRAVRKHLTRIHHDMNNPLSIVSGNVQLLQELAKALDLGSEFDPPLKDMVAAVEQLSGTTEELLVLKNLLAQLEEEDS